MRPYSYSSTLATGNTYTLAAFVVARPSGHTV